MSTRQYDVIVIGSGPGGYTAAIRCAQLGKKTAIIEKYQTLGGTCLNVGCIPTKALLDSTEHYHNAIHNFKSHGVEVNEIKYNLTQMMKRKDDVVDLSVKGVAHLMKKNEIDVYYGIGSFEDKNKVKITNSDGEKIIEGTNIIIATGSKPAKLPGIEIDKKKIITSTEAIALNEVPKDLLIIGAGAIGLEIVSVYSRLGSKVTVIEYMDTIIPTMDKGLAKELTRILKKHKFDIRVSHKVTGAKVIDNRVEVTAENNKGESVVFKGDYCLVAVGRRPYTDNLGLEKIGIEMDMNRVKVDENLETNVKDIYAIGDVILGPMLAHKASEEGVFVSEKIAGLNPHKLDYNLVPGVVYTWPEVSGIGYTEEELIKKGIEYKIGTFPFRASGRARASIDVDGLIKVLADKKTDVILGVHMIGARCADIIAEATVAIKYKATAEEIGNICHAHPTYAEVLKEACLDATSNRAIHN